MDRRRSHYHESWAEMDEAERIVQRYVHFTWSWMNLFQQPAISLGMIKMANEIIRLRDELKRAQERGEK